SSRQGFIRRSKGLHVYLWQQRQSRRRQQPQVTAMRVSAITGAGKRSNHGKVRRGKAASKGQTRRREARPARRRRESLRRPERNQTPRRQPGADAWRPG
ncbi:hypothetical protein U1Q18_017661, partial [Sarracenia purpurea var. burkii]